MVSSRTTQTEQQQYTIEDIVSEIQRGKVSGRSFFGDFSITASFNTFNSGVNSAVSYSGASILKNDLVNERDPDEPFKLTNSEFSLLQKRAKSVSKYGNIPYEISEDFLLILCFVDKIEDMRKISEAIDIPKLNDEEILRKPEQILSLPKLEKCCFVASAVEGLVNAFRRYISGTQQASTNDGESMIDIILGFGGSSSYANLIESSSPSDLVGNYLSELITGSRIPMSVISKNPNYQSPSYVGKAFFGESATSLSLVDIDEIFPKRIACFPKPSNGSGTTSFGIQNLNSFNNSMSVEQFVSKITFGTINIDNNNAKQKKVNDITSQLNLKLGTTANETIDVRRADTSIPLMIGLSSISSKTDRSPFSADTFKQGWNKANSIGNHLQQNSDSFFDAVKRFT